ncbi:MAG: HAD family phosphatase [Oscillospiraceae bacterium]|jgi:putative hydrolase of the HAD superfamily|nr:HAD family phosphatase [Oscillospiraceae bacterium]
MKQNIVFDMGGVLLDFSEQRLLTHYFGGCSLEEQAQVREAIFGSGIWRRMDRGDFDAAETSRAICTLLPERLHPLVQRMIPNYFEAMPPIPETNELAVQLKARGKRIYLLTNAPYIFMEEQRRVPCIDLFDGIFASCEVRLLKPQREIYLAFFERFHLNAADCFFVDDMRENIDGAAAVGMEGFCFAQRDIAGLRKALGIDS